MEGCGWPLSLTAHSEKRSGAVAEERKGGQSVRLGARADKESSLCIFISKSKINDSEAAPQRIV